MDARRQRTREAVLAAFGELVESKPYGKISVQDILDVAHVGRSTFYAHFCSKEALVKALAASICSHAVAASSSEQAPGQTSGGNRAHQVELILCNLREHEGGVRALVTGDASGLFADCLRSELYDRAKAELPDVVTGPAAQLDRGFLAHHIASSLVGTVHWWVRHDFTPSPAEVARNYLLVVEPLFEDCGSAASPSCAGPAEKPAGSSAGAPA